MRHALEVIEGQSRVRHERVLSKGCGRVGVAVAAIFALALAACATTQIKEQWRDPTYQASDGQRVLVIAVMSDSTRRHVMEDDLVARLRKAGVIAMPSYTKLSVVGPKDLDAVRRVVQEEQANLVLSVHLIDVKQQTYSSGSGHYGASPYGGYVSGYGAGGFYRYYPYAVQDAYNPPTTYTADNYTTETRLFDMQRNKQVWAAVLESPEPSDFDKAAAEYADLVVKQLRDNKVVGGG